MQKQNNDSNTLAHTKWNCKYHVVFAPKYRRKVFYEEKRAAIGKILRQLCEWKGVSILEAEACPDHVHMLLEIPPKIAVSSFMGAAEWNLNSDKIGYLGFSAGGGVAIAATMSAEGEERPDFLCTNFGPSLMPVSVPADAPPLLIMTRVDHPNVAAGLVALFMEWKKAGANAELHMYGDGKGPYELMPETGKTTTELWSSQMIQWLKAKGFIE